MTPNTGVLVYLVHARPLVGERVRGQAYSGSQRARARFPRPLCLLLVALALLTACQPGAAAGTASPGAPIKVSVALDWYPWSNHTGLLLAKDSGYYRQEGLDVSIYVPANPEDVLKLVGSGKDTLGMSYETDVLFARQEGVPVKSVAALVQHPLNTIITLKDSGITRPGQLAGKKVGTAGLPSDDAFLATMMAADGGDASQAEVINVGYDLVAALMSRQVDAIVGGYWVHESILIESKGYPVNIMGVEDWGVPDYYELVVVASDASVSDNPDVLRRFLRATARGYQEAARDHRRALDVLFRDYPETDQALEQKGIELLAPLWTAGTDRFGVQTAERWQAYGDWLKQHGLLKSDVDPRQAFTGDLVP